VTFQISVSNMPLMTHPFSTISHFDAIPIGIMAILGWVTIPAGMNNTGDSNDMYTSNLSHNHMKDNMIGINQNTNNISSSTKGDNTITTEKMSNMKGM
jgi:hypothetical protein